MFHSGGRLREVAMQINRFMLKPLLWWICVGGVALTGGVASGAQGTEEVAEVIFSIGEARLEGREAPLQRGDRVHVGQTVRTGENGHVHLRFVDKGYVSVRPRSRLTVDDYTRDVAQPDNNRVKFTLSGGTARLITGEASRQARHRFRLNTPVAAIGVRGTDFVVHAEDNLTRVTVKQGMIVASPFGAGCQAEALGPCGGENARELAASLNGQYLEIEGAGRPRTIVPQPGRGSPPFAPPRPEEPAVRQGDNGALPAGMNGSTNIMWGRWNAVAATPPGYEIVGENERFALFRAIESMQLPSAGEFNFRLAGGESYGRRSGGGYLPATVSNASLAVNFGKMTYMTKFDWSFEGIDQTFASKGTINGEGRFVMDRSASNVTVSGALSAKGDEAGLIYFKRLEDLKTNAYGVLHWQR